MTRPMRYRRVLSALVLLSLPFATIGAQQAGEGAAPSTKGMVLKGKAPVSNDVLRVKLPRPQEADLPNGVHLMVLEDHRLPQIAFQIIIPGAGGYYDDPAMTGLASYTAQLMREGTETRNSQQISQELERMAAFVNVGASVSGPNATVSGNAMTENFDRLFALAAEILLAPSFPADEWDRLKTRSRAGLIQQRANPGFLANEQYSRVIYGSHPAGRVSATPATLDAITRDAIVAFHRARYVPDHAASPSPATSRWPRPGKPSKPGSAAGRSAARRSRRSPIRRRSGPQGVHGRAAQFSADHAVRGHAVADAEGSGLRAAAGGEPGARRRPWVGSSGTFAKRRDTPTASAAAFRRRTSAATGRRRRRSGPR